MSSIHDDKSAQEEYCTNEGVHDPVLLGGHTNPSALAEELQLPVSMLCQTSQLSVKPFNKKFSTLRIPPRRLAFCGGGVRCVAHVGVLKALESAGILSCVKEMIGVSAGALFALMFVLGYTLPQVEELSLAFDFRVLGDITPEDILMFPLTFGLNSGDMIDKFIASILSQKGFHKDTTFFELSKKTKISFRCYATELQTSKLKEMGMKTTPTMMVREAVRASMSLPIMYSPVKVGDCLLVDGGLLHNLPLVFLTKEEIDETWGVLFVRKEESKKPIESIIDFFKYIYDGTTVMRNLPYIQKYKERIILVKGDEADSLNFGETKENRMKIIKNAYNSTMRFIKSTGRPLRRVSVS
jgi:predicted acylesterase/phospholipase RssA